MPDRVFSEQEIAQILQRAIEHQEAEAEKRRAHAHGLNLAELERLGQEVGIAPEHLRAAVTEVHRPSVRRDQTTSDTHNFTERLVPGYLTDAAWGEIVTELRHQIGVAGNDKLSVVGNMHEWSFTSGSGITTTASLTQRGNSVAVRLSQRVGMASSLTEGVLYGGIIAFLVALFLSEGVLDLVFLEATMLFAALLVILSTLVYTLDVAWRKKKHRQLEAIGDRIEALVDARPDTVDSAAPLPTVIAETRIELPEEEAPHATRSATANRTRT